MPADFYDHKIIDKFTVKVKYENTDYADVGDGHENGPPRLECYDRENNEWDHWRNFKNNVCDGCYTWVDDVTTPDVYPDDPQYHIKYSGGEKYQIHLLIDTPDGRDGAPGDDDAEIDINEIRVILHLRHHEPPNVNHISPAKGGNGKVNVAYENQYSLL